MVALDERPSRLETLIRHRPPLDSNYLPLANDPDPRVTLRDYLSQRLCKNDNLSAGRVFLYNAVCFNDLV